MSLQEAQEAPACGEHEDSRGTTSAPEHLDVPAGGTCRAGAPGAPGRAANFISRDISHFCPNVHEADLH